MKIRSEAQLDELLSSKLPLVVKFSASWCGPCRALAPRFEALAEQLQEKARFVEVDVDEIREAAVKHGVQSVPTLLLFKDGQAVARMIGAKTQEQLREWVEPHL